MDAFATFGALNDSQSNGARKQFFESELIDHITGSVLDSIDQENVDPGSGGLGSQTKKELDQVRALKLQKDAMGAQHSGNIDKAVALYQKLLDTDFVQSAEDSHPGTRMKYIAYKNIAKILPAERAEESIKFLLKAAEIDASETQLWWKLGMKSLEIGNILLAHNSFAKALSLSARHWPSIDKILYTGLVLNNFQDVIKRALAALKLDRKYGTARLALLKILQSHSVMFDDDEISVAESYDLENCTERDEKIFEKLFSKYEKRWIKYCKYTPLPPESSVTPQLKICELKCNKYSFASIGKSLVKNISKFDEGEFHRVSVAHLGGKKRRLKAIENVQISTVDPKRRKKDKSLKLPKKDRRKASSEDITEHSSAFSLIIPYLLPQEYRHEFNDCLGSSLNESAVQPEQLIISNANMDDEDEKRFMVVLREQEPQMLLHFLSLSKKPTKILNFTREFCLHLTGLTSKQWSTPLKNNFVSMWKMLESRRQVELVLSDDVRADILEMKPTKIVNLLYDLRGFILYTELEIDAEMVRRGLRLGPACLSPGNDGKDSLDDSTRVKNQNLARFVRQLFMYPSEMYSDNITEVRLRLMWLDAKMWVLRNDPKYMLQRLTDIQVFLVKNDQWEVNLPNIKEAPVISLAEVNRRIQTIQRAEQREEVERLFQDGNYSQVAELLWVTLRLKPSTAEVQPFPQERANQLCLLLKSLSFIAQNDDLGGSSVWKTWAQGIERAFAEVAARIRVRHSLPDWVNAAGQLCLNLLEEDSENFRSLFEAMSKSEMGRFQRSLSTFSAAQMELGPEPAVIRRSLVPVWLIGYHALNSIEQSNVDPERKISSESCASEESSQNGNGGLEDAIDMKQLKFYPDLEIPACVQLLITAHSELGSCNWCTDGNGSLLKFLIPTLSKLRKKLKSDPENQKIINFLTSELHQAIYCFVQFPAKKPKSITDHRSTKIPLNWTNVVLVFDVLFPEELPQFDTVKSNSISSELASFMKKCIPLIPDSEFETMRLSYSKIIRATHEAIPDDSEEDLKSWLDMRSASSPLTNFYYLLADFSMKNNSRDDAIKYYFMDVGFNPQRIDSWAAIALCKAAEIDEKMRSFESKGQFLPLKLIHCAIFCFERALELERNGKILIEFGQMLYWLAGYDLEQSREYFQKSYALFEEALAVAPEEAWLTHYMLGKLAEKLKKGNECLNHYHHALEWMDEFASYPAKIPSKTNSGTFCHETLEVFYRITAFLTKKYEAGEDVLDFKNDILGLLQKPVFTRDGDEKVDATQFSFATNADIVQQCIRNYELILKRYPQHYKSYYRLAKLAYHADNPSLAKRIILVDKNSQNSSKEETNETKAGKFQFNDEGSLFGDRNRHNFFGGIWRIPSEDIDRPGAFSKHLAKCCRLVVLCAEKTQDIVLLATIFSALQKTPDAAKRYLKENDRELIYKPIISTILGCQDLMIKQQLSHLQARKRLVKFHRITEILQKKIIGSEVFSKLQEFMKKAYGLAQTSDNERAGTLESINKYVKAIIAMEKAIAESPNASHDVQAHLKKNRGDQIQTSISKQTPLVPAPELPKPTIPQTSENRIVTVVQPSAVIDLTGGSSTSPLTGTSAEPVKNVQTATTVPIVRQQVVNQPSQITPASLAALFSNSNSNQQLSDQQKLILAQLRKHLNQ